MVSISKVVTSTANWLTYLENRVIQCLLECNLVVRMLLGSVPAIVTCLLAQTLCFFVKEVWYICLGNNEDDNGQTDSSKDGQDPKYPLGTSEKR